MEKVHRPSLKDLVARLSISYVCRNTTTTRTLDGDVHQPEFYLSPLFDRSHLFADALYKLNRTTESKGFQPPATVRVPFALPSCPRLQGIGPIIPNVILPMSETLTANRVNILHSFNLSFGLSHIPILNQVRNPNRVPTVVFGYLVKYKFVAAASALELWRGCGEILGGASNV